MVARSHLEHDLNTPRAVYSLPDNRCCGYRLGSSTRRDSDDGSLDKKAEEMALEQERAVRSICSHTEAGNPVEGRACTSPVRKSDSGGLYPQRRRNALTEFSGFNVQVADADGPTELCLSAHYLPGRYNCIADHLSRGRRLPEWHLLLVATEQLFNRWGTPDVDLFASAETAVVKDYVLLDSRDCLALYSNAFSRQWDFQLGWVFPPPNLMLKVLAYFNSARG